MPIIVLMSAEPVPKVPTVLGKSWPADFGLLANCGRREQLAQVRELLQVMPADRELNCGDTDGVGQSAEPTFACPDCRAA